MLLAVAAVFMSIWCLGLAALQQPPVFIHGAAVIAIGCLVAHFYLHHEIRRSPNQRDEPHKQRDDSTLLRGK
jgi:hypothetical protein